MIVVTAPTGHIGSQILSNLLPADEPLRVVARDPEKLPALVRDRAEVVTGSHKDPEVIDRALAGADSLFWLMPADSIKKEGVITGTLPGDLKAPAAATRDIAAVAARLPLDRTWTGQDSLGVLGPEDRRTFLSYGYSEGMAQGMIDMDIAKERGLDKALTRTPENTTPTSFRQWVAEVLKPALASD